MPTTSYVDFTGSVRGIGARTTSAGAAADDISAEEDRLAHAILSEGALSGDAFLVQADSGMDLAVGSGSAKADRFVVSGEASGQESYLVRLDATSITVTVPAADAAQARTDEIYLIIADAPYDGGSVSLPRIGYRQGDVGGATPGVDAAWKASALLARVSVPASDTAIGASQITDVRAFSTVAGALPVGSVSAFVGASAPSGFLLCDGSTVSRTTYRRLFRFANDNGLVGSSFGAGDGSTTFTLPDLRGRFPVGYKSTDTAFDALGETGGAKTVTLTTNELPAHTHDYVDTEGSEGVRDNTGTNSQAALVGDADVAAVTASTGNGAAFSILNPYLTVNWLIKT